LVKKIMGYGSSIQHLPSIQHGHTFEPLAREKYLSIVKDAHSNFKHCECGLFVDKEKPYLGATPDLVIECDCCALGVSEFKCPFSIAQECPSAQNLSYLHVEPDSNITKLKEVHPYYAQVQGQMGVCNRKYCDFFIYTNGGYFLQRIPFDDSYWNKLEINLEYFFKNYLSDELVFGKLK